MCSLRSASHRSAGGVGREGTRLLGVGGVDEEVGLGGVKSSKITMFGMGWLVQWIFHCKEISMLVGTM